MSVERAGFWRGRRVLVTGHTGFKGAWLALILQRLGARVSGISLPPEPGPSLFTALAPWSALEHREIDLADSAALTAALHELRPEVVFHLAAQAFVGRSYRQPTLTFATNVVGTMNLLEALRCVPGIAAALIVTSDKVYRNDGTGRAFIESDPLGGADPYSASKAAVELLVASWRASFADELPVLATARAGNVIGGGDFGEDRLLPDLVRAQLAGLPLAVRRPEATRPWQHVLDVLRGYLTLARALVEAPAEAPRAVNFGPPVGDGVEYGLSVRDMIGLYERAGAERVRWEQQSEPIMAEAPRLSIDPSLAAHALGWRVHKSLELALAETAVWYRAWRQGTDMRPLTGRAIDEAFA